MKLNFNPPVIAHRGANLLAPENTLAAFREAKKLGVSWVEFDVMLAACGTPVIIHDETIDRTTDGKGLVREYTYQELEEFSAGEWFGNEFANERIPTLKQTLQLFQELNLNANIEIKAFPGTEAQTVINIFKVLNEVNPTISTLVTSFSVPALEEVRKISHHIFIGHLMDAWDPEWETICDELNCSIVDVDHEILTPEKISEIKKSHRFLLSYTVNSPARAQELFSLGVDVVFSDCPDIIISML